jgi:hypothetical protein
MTTASWLQQLLEHFDERTDPHNEIDIAQALSDERAKHGDLSEEDWKTFLAEHSAFFFRGSREGLSTWGTYFAPMAELTRGDSASRLP